MNRIRHYVKIQSYLDNYLLRMLLRSGVNMNKGVNNEEGA